MCDWAGGCCAARFFFPLFRVLVFEMSKRIDLFCVTGGLSCLWYGGTHHGGGRFAVPSEVVHVGCVSRLANVPVACVAGMYVVFVCVSVSLCCFV